MFLFALDRIGGGLVEPDDDFGAHRVDHVGREDQPETAVDGCQILVRFLDGGC